MQGFGLNLGTVLAGGAAAAAGAFAAFVVSSAKAADAIGDAADRAGVAVESLSRLKYAASQSDVEFGALTTGIKKWQVTLSQAASGGKDASKALDLIKLSASSLKDLSLEDQLAKIADQFQRIRDPADRTRVAVELFGRSGEQLVPLLQKGGNALRQFAKDADDASITLDEATTKRIDVALKRWEKLKDIMLSFGARVAGGTAAAFGVFGDELDKQSTQLEYMIKLREQLMAGFSDQGQDPARTKQIEDLTKKIEAARIAVARLSGELGRSGHGPIKGGGLLDIPVDTSATDKLMEQLEQVRVSESLLKDPLIEWEKQTRTSAEKVAAEFAEFQANLEVLVQHGRISGGEAQKRSNERLDEILQPIQISVSRLAVPLTAAQEKAKEFTDTLKTGLENAARAGEITGKSILRNLVAAFESKILYNAIDSFANYLSNAIQKASSTGGSSTGGFLSGLLGAFLVHAAGGGRISGPTIVGEDGPEVVTGNGRVFNRRQLAFSGTSGVNVSFGDTQIVVQGDSDPRRTAEYVEARIQQNNRKQLEQVSRILKNNGYGDLR